MTWFVETEPYGLDPDEYALGVRAMKAAASELGIATPLLRWFVGPVSEGAGIRAERDFAGFEATRSTVGRTSALPGEVWIRAGLSGLSRHELVKTVGHEAEHVRQERTAEDDLLDKRGREARAERFGEQFANRFLSRPRGIKSAIVVEDLVDREGRFSATARVPGIRSWTDLGLELYQRRPLLVDNVLSLKGERSGYLGDAEAREEAVWFKAQLDMNARYRGRIARLIEQGRMTYSADALANGAETAAKSFTRWPLLLGTMRPASQ